LSELLKGRSRQEMPTLSPDQEAELNYKLEVAYLFKNEISLRYYEDGTIHQIQGVILRTDMMNKLIFIDRYALSAYQIIDIEVI
ncbi:MAG: YolD-like family protein, partial [Firmicutes bacterium]|nr:YolD-like family protein [Bacillota bacterium]